MANSLKRKTFTDHNYVETRREILHLKLFHTFSHTKIKMVTPFPNSVAQFPVVACMNANPFPGWLQCNL